MRGYWYSRASRCCCWDLGKLLQFILPFTLFSFTHSFLAELPLTSPPSHPPSDPMRPSTQHAMALLLLLSSVLHAAPPPPSPPLLLLNPALPPPPPPLSTLPLTSTTNTSLPLPSPIAVTPPQPTSTPSPPSPPDPFILPIPRSPVSLRFYSYGPAYSLLPRSPALICLAALRHDVLAHAGARDFDKGVGRPLEFRVRGVGLSVVATGRRLSCRFGVWFCVWFWCSFFFFFLGRGV